MKISINKKIVKVLLFSYTIFVILIAVFTSFSLIPSPDRIANAACNVDACVQAELTYCNSTYGANQPALRQACTDGAYNRCMSTEGIPSGKTKCEEYYAISDNPGGGGGEPTTQPVPYPYDVTYCNPDGTGTTNCVPVNDVDPLSACVSWNVYECTEPLACYTFDRGCPNGSVSGRLLDSNVSTTEARALLNDPLNCGVRQADCTTISGLYLSRVNCTGNCAIANPPAQPPVQPPVNPPSNPPSNPQTVQCNDTCNSTDRLCPSNLSCVNVDGINRCRLPSNPSSSTCQPPSVTVACNDTCNNTDRLCPSNLACINIDGTNRCRLPLNFESATCEPLIPQNPNYTIDKYVDGGRTSYNIGDLVPFKIRITNTGETTLTNIKFRDVYNSNYLTYVNGSAIKSSGGSISEINSVLTRNISGTIEIENILSTNILGSLSVGNYIEITLRFIAKAPINETCNYGYIDAPDLPEISDNACIGSKNIDTDI